MDKPDNIVDLIAELNATLGDTRGVMAELYAKADAFARIGSSLDADLRRLNELRKELANDMSTPMETLDKVELLWAYLNLLKTTFELASQNLNYYLCWPRKSVGKNWGQVEKEIE